MLRTIFKIDIWETQKNWPEGKKMSDYAQGVTSKRWHKQTVYYKKKEDDN